MRRRLQWQIFGALSLTGALCVALATLAASLFWDDPRPLPPFVRDVGAFIVDDLPEGDRERMQHELRRRARRLHASISVWDQHGQLAAQAGQRLERPRPSLGHHSGWDHDSQSLWVELGDGRSMALAFEQPPMPPRLFFRIALLVLVAALLLGSHLAAQLITRRLKELERGVTRFGEGDLEARVNVRGQDEIAGLARAFNRSSARIAGLVKQQRRMLQSASHELRSPLARLRMALELATEPELSGEERDKLRGNAARDIDELDLLIGDLLLAGRLADTELPKDFSEVPLGEVVREEAARVRAEVDAEPVTLAGNPRMLRSLVRNLLENARRYGRDPIRVSLARAGDALILHVDDAGCGVPEGERERIFEAFYRPPGHRETQDGGVGLGLSLVRSIAEHHAGSVEYVPLPQGSRFEVRLPYSS